eukprot:GHRQ01034993.1.p1 GENE.GHRQ01034993.1~~GHRQ01034993.1.p1  ORF type:complete len:149 (+),score=38.76 GHRQ01034993.1:35-448(+)
MQPVVQAVCLQQVSGALCCTRCCNANRLDVDFVRLLQVWRLKTPPAGWAFPQKRMQNFFHVLGAGFAMFVQVRAGSNHAAGCSCGSTNMAVVCCFQCMVTLQLQSVLPMLWHRANQTGIQQATLPFPPCQTSFFSRA